MLKVLFVALIFYPLISLGQSLPLKELESIGLTPSDINVTEELNGVNGVNGYYLVVSRENMSTNPLLDFLVNNYALYSPSGELTYLTDYKLKQSEIIYFEFVEDKLFLLEKIFSPRNDVRISTFSIKTAKLISSITGEIPCKYGNDCDWIRYEEKKLAFFTNTGLNVRLKFSSIYEYDWRLEETTLIYENVGDNIDAGTGRNFDLGDVMFDIGKGSFRYIK